ncbi:MAG: BlaI/MecI/CopY family transcriptional regulator [Verrucomicrobiota bacterium]
MQLLWGADDALKPSEIESQFSWPIENTTLRSVLAVMLDRGDLDREKRGKAYHYFPRQLKTEALGDMLSGLVRLFGSRSRVGLVSRLMQEESLTDEEVRHLKELALDTETPTTKAPKK